jgi:hypothetical protein
MASSRPASLCYAAGQAGQLPLAERWTPRGGWARVTLPAPRGSMGSDLGGISRTSATQCAAVGSYGTPTAQFGLIEQLKGSAWNVSTAPRLPARGRRGAIVTAGWLTPGGLSEN